MCGIVGLVGHRAGVETARRIVEAMAERIHHRGPDGGGVEAHADATLGMKRLAIVDVAHGHQPMSNEDGSITLVYNGEIYNAPELRRSLVSQGVRFVTRSDTEVILRLYERQPDDIERHLAGMWAFAIHDRRRRRVVLSRDRFGIKPLFVADTGSSVAFASELAAFDRSLSPFETCFTIDSDAAHAMLSYSYVPETATIWTGVQRLEPGTRTTIQINTGARTTSRYWELVPNADARQIRSLDSACEAVDAALRRSVREHLESDVPVASFLSGGIDSSLISAYASELSSEPIRAFCIGFREERFDESPFARQTAEKLGIPIDVRMLDERTGRENLVAALAAYDEPFGDSSSLATFLLCGHAARTHKVALGGDGGDEVFAGYKKHLIHRIRGPFEPIPRLRDMVARTLGRLPVRTDRTRGWTELLRSLRRLARGLEGPLGHVQAELAQVVPLARTAPLMRGGANASKYVAAARERFERSHGDDLQRMLASEIASSLANDMLVKVDRASMAHHLEVRVPFLDHRVVELGLGLPAKFSLGRNGKQVLRTLHERRFGTELANRKKQGFGVPVEAWLRGPLDGAAERLFDTRRLDQYGLLSSDALGEGRFRDWVRRDPIVVWHAFALAAWCEIHLGGGRDALSEIVEEGRTRDRNGAVVAAERPRPVSD